MNLDLLFKEVDRAMSSTEYQFRDDIEHVNKYNSLKRQFKIDSLSNNLDNSATELLMFLIEYDYIRCPMIGDYEKGGVECDY